jgi:polyphosphate kinase
VVLELMARFDEEANISWASHLEDAGAMVYGVFGYKTHAKMLLVIRREDGRPAPLCAPGHRQLPPAHRPLLHRLGPAHRQRRNRRDVADIFKQLTGWASRPAQAPVAGPFTCTACCSTRSNREIARAKAGSTIIAKMNALLEPQVIRPCTAPARPASRST